MLRALSCAQFALLDLPQPLNAFHRLLSGRPQVTGEDADRFDSNCAVSKVSETPLESGIEAELHPLVAAVIDARQMTKFDRSSHLKSLHKKATRGQGGRFCKALPSLSVSFAPECPEAPAYRDTHLCSHMSRTSVVEQVSTSVGSEGREWLKPDSAVHLEGFPLSTGPDLSEGCPSTRLTQAPARALRPVQNMSDAVQPYHTLVAENLVPDGFCEVFTFFLKKKRGRQSSATKLSSLVQDRWRVSSNGFAQGQAATHRNITTGCPGHIERAFRTSGPLSLRAGLKEPAVLVPQVPQRAKTQSRWNASAGSTHSNGC